LQASANRTAKSTRQLLDMSKSARRLQLARARALARTHARPGAHDAAARPKAPADLVGEGRAGSGYPGQHRPRPGTPMPPGCRWVLLSTRSTDVSSAEYPSTRSSQCRGRRDQHTTSAAQENRIERCAALRCWTLQSAMRLSAMHSDFDRTVEEVCSAHSHGTRGAIGTIGRLCCNCAPI
jgi:hypothetical protein